MAISYTFFLRFHMCQVNSVLIHCVNLFTSGPHAIGVWYQMNVQFTFCICSSVCWPLLRYTLQLNNSSKQESPPAWTQEAYHPSHSKSSLCCCFLTGGVPHPESVPPMPGPGMGVPPCPDLRWGPPPGSLDAVNPPPPPPKCEQTDTFVHGR